MFGKSEEVADLWLTKEVLTCLVGAFIQDFSAHSPPLPLADGILSPEARQKPH